MFKNIQDKLGIVKKEEIKKELNQEVEKTNLEKAKGLVDFGAKHQNPIEIIESGGNFNVEKIKGIDSCSIENFLFFLKTYLNGPIFTDTYNKNHGYGTGRREWEKKYQKLMEEDILQYYNSNRLGNNKIGQVISALDIFSGELEDADIKNKLKDTQLRIQKEVGNLINKDEKEIQIYHSLEDEEKVELVKKFSEIVKELVDILEKDNTK